MGELRDRMERDLAIRGLRETTCDAYLRCVTQYAAYHRRSPAEMGKEEIRQYLLHLLEDRELKSSSLGVHIGALKFLYNVTLERPEEVATLKSPEVRQRLPEVLTPSEVELLLMGVARIKPSFAIAHEINSMNFATFRRIVQLRPTPPNPPSPPLAHHTFQPRDRSTHPISPARTIPAASIQASSTPLRP